MGGWWHDLIADGSNGSTYVQALQGKVEAWSTWAEIRRCNPLTAISGDFRKRLLVERDAARVDSRLKGKVGRRPPDAWYAPDSVKIGYEISFTRHSNKPQPLRHLEEIRADIFALEQETEGLLAEVIGGRTA